MEKRLMGQILSHNVCNPCNMINTVKLSNPNQNVIETTKKPTYEHEQYGDQLLFEYMNILSTTC